MKYFLGIDGGGTRTRALVVDTDGAVRGFALGGTGNYINAGLDRAATTLIDTARSAAAQAAVSLEAIDSAFCGLAAVKSTAERRLVRDTLIQRGGSLRGQLVVANDSEAALAGGLSGRPGIVLIAGTGSHCFGRSAQGRSTYCGGWGWLLDDVGGGYGLGSTGLRTAVRQIDGREPETSLAPRLLACLGIADPLDLPERIHAAAFGVREIAALAPEIIALAEAGDPAACDIVEEAARELSRLVENVAAQLDLAAPELVLAGSVARSSGLLGRRLRQHLRIALPRLTVVEPEMAPAAGAALRALELGGVPLTREVRHRLRADAAALALG